jgi:hypothetical protein
MKEKINKAWHEKNVLGKNAPLAKRISWHLRHQENCSCRPVPTSVANEIKGKKVKTCSRSHKFVGKGPCPVCWPGGSRK